MPIKHNQGGTAVESWPRVNQSGTAVDCNVYVNQGGDPVLVHSPVEITTHYDAHDLTAGHSDGDPVGLWPDSKGDMDATQAQSGKQPTYQSSGINGNPSLSFDGSDMLAAGYYQEPLTQPYSLVGVFEVVDDGSPHMYVYYGADMDQRSFFDAKSTTDGPSGKFQFWAGTPGGLTMPHDEQPHVFVVVADGTRSILRIDNQVIVGDAGNLNHAGLTIGERSDALRGFSGYIGELRAYNRRLGDDEADNLVANLMSKWGIQ